MPEDHRDHHPLADLADRIYRSAVLRHLLFLLAAGATVLLIGYHFGTFDHAVHIPYLKKFVDPSLYPGDKFLDLRHQHFSYFWLLFVPFYQLGILEIALFATHMLATYLAFWALWALADELFHNPLTCLLGVLALILPHVGFAGFMVFEWSFLNRTFVLPFLLWAIVLFLRRRYLLAFALLGLLYNLHVISVAFVLLMFLFDGLLEWRKIGWRNLVLGFLLFVIGALPVLVWKASASPVDFTLRPELLSIVSRGMAYNLFHLFSQDLLILFPTASGFSALALFFIGRGQAKDGHHRTLTNFVYTILIVLGVLVITSEWLPITVVIQSQIIRIGVFAIIFGYLYFADRLVRLSREVEGRPYLGAMGSVFILASSAILPLVTWGAQAVARTTRGRQIAVAALVPLLLGLNLVMVLRSGLWSPGIYIFARQTPWYEAQIWARDNTPKDALFITPPYIWGYYEPDWRVFSERSTVVTRTELLEASFVPEYLDHWLPRFNLLAPGAVERFRGNNPENVAITRDAFYSLSTADLVRIAQQYGASYLVAEAPHTYDLPVVYQNDRFVIYRFPRKEGD